LDELLHGDEGDDNDEEEAEEDLMDEGSMDSKLASMKALGQLLVLDQPFEDGVHPSRATILIHEGMDAHKIFKVLDFTVDPSGVAVANLRSFNISDGLLSALAINGAQDTNLNQIHHQMPANNVKFSLTIAGSRPFDRHLPAVALRRRGGWAAIYLNYRNDNEETFDANNIAEERDGA